MEEETTVALQNGVGRGSNTNGAKASPAERTAVRGFTAGAALGGESRKHYVGAQVNVTLCTGSRRRIARAVEFAPAP